MGKREQNAEYRRSSLLEASERLGREKGWSAVSVEDITRAAGMAKGSFYTYFSSKQALRSALEARRFRDITEQIPSIALSSDPVSGTVGYMTHVLDLATAGGVQSVRRLLGLIASTSDEAGADFFFDFAQLFRIFEQQRVLRKKTPIAELVEVFDALTIGILASWAADPHRSEEGRRIDERLNGLEKVAVRRILKPWLRKKKQK